MQASAVAQAIVGKVCAKSRDLEQQAFLCRVRTVAGQRRFEFKSAPTASYVNAGINAVAGVGEAPVAGYHSIVQDLAWPSPQDDVPLQHPSLAPPQPERPWFQEDLLAHTLQFRQMLQPAVKAIELQVLPICCHAHACGIRS